MSTEREMFEFRVFGSFRVHWNVPIQININLCYVGQQIRCQFMVFIANSLLYPLHLNRTNGMGMMIEDDFPTEAKTILYTTGKERNEENCDGEIFNCQYPLAKQEQQHTRCRGGRV